MNHSNILIMNHRFIYLTGEHKQWCKRTLYEESLRAPAFIHIPGRTDDVVKAAGLEQRM